MTDCCRTCGNIRNEAGETGECHAEPPTVVPSGRKAAFPIVDLADWCRRHVPREPVAAPKRPKKIRTVEQTGAPGTLEDA
ncbi:MAG TPA: hypothetical protein HA263_08070 [Methanoregulaceae archaeon]|nr:hypothetical protein [Methanoregulaceae archaeon]